MSSEDAALLSRAVGKPVRVQWMRDDEHGWEPKGPAQLDIVRAGVDSTRQNYRLGLCGSGFSTDRCFGRRNASACFASNRYETHGRRKFERHRGGGEMYAFENQKCAATADAVGASGRDPASDRLSCALRVMWRALLRASRLWMRSPLTCSRSGAVSAALSRSNKRGADAFVAAAKKAGWQERPSPATDINGIKGHGTRRCDLRSRQHHLRRGSRSRSRQSQRQVT